MFRKRKNHLSLDDGLKWFLEIIVDTRSSRVLIKTRSSIEITSRKLSFDGCLVFRWFHLSLVILRWVCDAVYVTGRSRWTFKCPLNILHKLVYQHRRSFIGSSFNYIGVWRWNWCQMWWRWWWIWRKVMVEFHGCLKWCRTAWLYNNWNNTTILS